MRLVNVRKNCYFWITFYGFVLNEISLINGIFKYINVFIPEQTHKELSKYKIFLHKFINHANLVIVIKWLRSNPQNSLQKTMFLVFKCGKQKLGAG